VTPAAPALVRDALASDLPALARLGARLARMHHRLDPARFFVTEDLEAGYAWWLGKERRSRKAVVLAAVRGAPGRERAVGYAYGRLEPRDWNTLREACGVGIDLFVEPAERGRGTGRALVLALCERLEARGAPRVVIDVAARNPEAQAVFERLGFRPTMLEMAREGGAAQRKGRAARAARKR
jgi:RimJ/RimL family protein N-acetyltransferase